MAGLFGLFGKKAKYVDEVDSNTSNESVKKEAFFLETDEAQSLGNAEYMRTPVKIKRSFPKIMGSKGKEIVTEVSAMETKKIQANGQPTSTPSSSSPEEAPAPVKNERRSSDNSLDMFRKMAKDLKK